MPEVNGRHAGEAIESGGAGLSVADLLARVSPTPVAAAPAAAPSSADDIAALIAAEAGRYLPTGEMTVDTDFFEAGGTSVSAVELVAVLADQGIELALDDVFADARPSTLAAGIAKTGPAPVKTKVVARRDADDDLGMVLEDLALVDNLPWTGPPEAVVPRRIFITGATGFLGTHVLMDLLRHSEAHVHCLVRAADVDAAYTRLGEALKSFALPWSGEVRRRVTVHPGDLRQERLGLSEQDWAYLCTEVDAIVGVGAAVDFLRGYPSLRQSNVLGPLQLAEMAITGKSKPLHHISSIAVFNEVGIESMGEDDPVARIDNLFAGYDKTKWAAEAALRRARDHGLVVTMLRPGGIGGHTKTGVYNAQDLSSGLISAFGRFRTVPAFKFLNAAPVDWVSRVTAAVILEPEAWGYNYNLTGVPNTLEDVTKDMDLGGMNVRVQDWDTWRTETLAKLEADPIPELHFLTRVLQSPTALKLCEATLTGPAAGATRTDAFVAGAGLAPAARYDTQRQLKTFERLAADGLGRLPARTDQPHLWFPETMLGSLTPVGGHGQHPCSTALTLSMASMYQLIKERRLDVRGEIRCSAIHQEPLTVEHGDIWVRPQEGIPLSHGMRHPLLQYRLRLRDADGEAWWLEGFKYARARRDVWRQTRALTVEIGREDEPASYAGEIVVPADSYVREQIDGIRTNPALTESQARLAKLTWLAWFAREMGRGLAGPFTRVAADLLDLRRNSILSERKK